MNDTSPPPRSRLVTILAWCFIAYSGFGLCMALLQLTLVSTLLSADQIQELIKQSNAPVSLPPLALFVLRHLQALTVAILVMQVVTLTAAIALLKRRNWARLFFVVMLSLGAFWNIAGIFIQHYAMASLVRLPPDLPAEFRTGFEAMTVATQMISAVMAIGLSVLFAWLIRQLLSEPIKHEFV